MKPATLRNLVAVGNIAAAALVIGNTQAQAQTFYSSPTFEQLQSSVFATSNEKIVTETQAQWFGPSKSWHRVNNYGYDRHMVWAAVNGSKTSNAMVWRSGLASGRYAVYAYIPKNYASTQNAKYDIEYYASNKWTGIAGVTVNQNSISDAWASLGEYDFPGEPAVYLGDNTDESYALTKRVVGFSAIKFVKIEAALPVKAQAPYFYQRDIRWATKRLAPSPYTMKDAGCVVTVLASIASWGGCTTDPGVLCDWLSSHNGFYYNSNLTSMAKFNEYAGKTVVSTSTQVWKQGTANLKLIKSELDAGRPVMLEVHWQRSSSEAYAHWVVAVGYSLKGSEVSDITIMDPQDSSGQYISLKKKYAYDGSLTKWIFAANLFKRK